MVTIMKGTKENTDIRSVKERKPPLRYMVSGYLYKTPLGGCRDNVKVLIFDGTPKEKFDPEKTRHTVHETSAAPLRISIAQKFAFIFSGLLRSDSKLSSKLNLHSSQISYIQNLMCLNQKGFADLIGISPSRISEYIKANDTVPMDRTTKLSIMEHLLAETRSPGYARKILQDWENSLEDGLSELNTLMEDGSMELKYG